MSDLIASGLLPRLVAVLARTWRMEIVGEEHVARLRAASIPVVFAVWHGSLLAPLWHRRGEGVTLLVSEHGDAAYLARAALEWGYRVVRGSSTRGHLKGLRGVLRSMALGHDVAFAADGPRGPARRAKQGPTAVARHGGGAVIPVGAEASSSWRLGSWDRFCIPRPFARVRVVYGPPLIAEGEGRNEAASPEHLTERLDVVQDRATCRA